MDAIFTGDIFGFILALPAALFLAFWMSSVKNWVAVVVGAFIGTLLGFFGILVWVGNLFGKPILPGANGVSTFFGSLFICAVLGLVGAIVVDLLVASRSSRDYRRQIVHE